ncbi:hypothetical protein LCGC14_1402120 [marine sediment metagenome]|uniref:Uncharacterized protein n=1 Tax=marine sediment metagenome TaxID=412755 RepID=A0A0F9JWV5_9ZZZZ
MDTVTVRVKELLATVKENREAHRTLFLTAQGNYREQMVKELDSMLADARAGRRIRRAVSMPEPEDHTADYDRVIRMLEMSVDEEVELHEDDFSRYVMDQWEWARSFASNTMAYVGKK